MEFLIGTYSKRDSKGIYKFKVDENGLFLNENIFCEIKDSKYISLYDNLIFSIFSKKGKSGVAIIDRKGAVLKELLYEESPSCYITIIDDYIYTANYHTGDVSKIKYQKSVNEINLELKTRTNIKNKAGAHMIFPFLDKIIVPCLLMDKIFVLNKDLETEKVISFKKGSGPRHLAVSKDYKYIYLVCELSCELLMLDVNNDFKEIKKIKLTEDFTKNPSAAAIRMSEDKKTLYISVRGTNTILIVDIENDNFNILQNYQLTIEHPRDILNIEKDKYLLVSGMNSDKVVSYSIKDRIIQSEVDSVEIKEGVSIIAI